MRNSSKWLQFLCWIGIRQKKCTKYIRFTHYWTDPKLKEPMYFCIHLLDNDKLFIEWEEYK